MALDREVSLQESISNFHPEFSQLFGAFSPFCPIKQRQAIQNWGDVSKNFSYDLFGNIADVLASLQSNRLKFHLWTARDESSARVSLKNHGIENLFTTMSFATESELKPHSKNSKI